MPAIEFEVDTVMEEALVRVTNRLSQVSGYPEAVREPVVETANSSGPPLAVIAIRHPQKGSVAAYRTWVQDEILPELIEKRAKPGRTQTRGKG